VLQLEPLCFCTNNVPGQDLAYALDIAQECGFRWVELAAIDGISEQISIENISDTYVAEVRKQLEQRGLRCYAVSGHCDMTDPDQFSGLLKKIEFAGKIGAKYLNTRCGPKYRWRLFKANVSQAALAARRWNITLNLESYGDIVGLAQEVGPVFDALALDNVGYTYDTGNNFRFAKGNIVMEKDLKKAVVTPDYLHLKDASLKEGWIYNEAIGSGSLNIPAIFDALEQLRDSIPCSLELPLSFRVQAKDLTFDFREPTRAEICQAVTQSLDFISQHASFAL